MDSLSRTTLGSQIASVLRNDILFGRLRAGERLGQQQLCARFKVSRMPVRDALHQLQFEGSVKAEGGGRNLVVAPMRRRDIVDTYAIQGMLHGLAARRVTTEAADDSHAELTQAHQDMVRHQEDLSEMATLNWHFHRRINHLAESDKLTASLRALSRQIPKDYLLEVPGWAERANAEHQEIVDAIRGRDPDAAEQLMRSHVIGAGEDLLRFLESNDTLSD